MYLSRYSIAWRNPTSWSPELRRRRRQILEEFQTVDRLRRGNLIAEFFVKKREGKTMRQGPFYVWQGHFGWTDYLCICTNSPSPLSDGPSDWF
jgi:hypothetical protein